jgi:hypothetical protein
MRKEIEPDVAEADEPPELDPDDVPDGELGDEDALLDDDDLEGDLDLDDVDLGGDDDLADDGVDVVPNVDLVVGDAEQVGAVTRNRTSSRKSAPVVETDNSAHEGDTASSEDDDDDLEDDDDVEASLDVILKERLVVADDDDEEYDVTDAEDRAEANQRVLPKQPAIG